MESGHIFHLCCQRIKGLPCVQVKVRLFYQSHAYRLRTKAIDNYVTRDTDLNTCSLANMHESMVQTYTHIQVCICVYIRMYIP